MWRVSRTTGNFRTPVLHGERPWAPSRSTLTTRESRNPEVCNMFLFSFQTDKFNLWERSPRAERTVKVPRFGECPELKLTFNCPKNQKFQSKLEFWNRREMVSFQFFCNVTWVWQSSRATRYWDQKQVQVTTSWLLHLRATCSYFLSVPHWALPQEAALLTEHREHGRGKSIHFNQ